MEGLYKRAFYNECFMGFGQLLMAIVTHYHIKEDSLEDPNVYPIGAIHVSRTKKLLPYIYLA